MPKQKIHSATWTLSAAFEQHKKNFNSVEDVKICITSTLLESIDLQFFRVKVKSSNKALFNQKKLWETTKIKEKKNTTIKISNIKCKEEKFKVKQYSLVVCDNYQEQSLDGDTDGAFCNKTLVPYAATTPMFSS